MTFWEWFGLVAGLLVLLGILYFEVVRPLLILRSAFHRLAAGDFRPVLLQTRSGLFRQSSRSILRLAEMLQQLDRQITDEGFSLRAILSSMVEGVLIVDRNQRVRLANDAIGRMFSLHQSPVNRTVIEVFRSYELQQTLDRALDGNLPRRIELDVKTPSGTRHFEVYAGALITRSGKPPGAAVVVFHDISAVKELEAVRKEFVANVSHEFRTPLAIINGYLETLIDGGAEDPELRDKALKVMSKNGKRLADLIEDLLTLSRLEHRTQQLDFRPMNLRQALDHVIERLEPAIRERSATIKIHWDPCAEHTVGDSRRIEQVFSNLLENSLRYGNQNSTTITISAALENEETIAISFSDNGPGIPLPDQKHIFERFYRVSKDRSRGAGGTGLGLSIVKHIVQSHGGTVTLDSHPGQGASFHIRLPMRQPS
ncbi:MAG: ATP-binding protein [Terrimicrobiaceae bacterium]